MLMNRVLEMGKFTWLKFDLGDKRLTQLQYADDILIKHVIV